VSARYHECALSTCSQHGTGPRRHYTQCMCRPHRNNISYCDTRPRRMRPNRLELETHSTAQWERRLFWLRWRQLRNYAFLRVSAATARSPDSEAQHSDTVPFRACRNGSTGRVQRILSSRDVLVPPQCTVPCCLLRVSVHGLSVFLLHKILSSSPRIIGLYSRTFNQLHT